ncbi:sarcolemmal membrane-associated protein-like [Hetaerina americana]|uniref:sarcolemmal membrane-associated protein-like n=1 Tax=Hetaerina americana TaxID=62018 RepID=UPI003A7F4213
MIENSSTILPSVIRDTSKVYEQISVNLRESKVNLNNITENQITEREALRRLCADKLRSERHLCSLEALVLNLRNEMDELKKKNQDLIMKISNATWNQNKADLIGNSEKRSYERKEAVIEKYIAENDIRELISKNYTNYGKEREDRARETYEKKILLKAELNKINNKIAETTSEVFKIEQENKVLQKRNSALRLRLQRLLKETELRRNQIGASLERINQEKCKKL